MSSPEPPFVWRANVQSYAATPVSSFLSHPPRTVSVMRLFNRTQDESKPTLDPFAHPVAYLASLGIEAELVEVIACLPEAA